MVANTTEKEHRDIEDKNEKRNKNSIFMPIMKKRVELFIFFFFGKHIDKHLYVAYNNT